MDAAPLGQSSDQVAQSARGGQYYSDAAPTMDPTADTLAESAPAESRADSLSTDYSAATPPVEMNEPAAAIDGGLAYRDTGALADPAQADSQLVVVRVVARKAALEAKTFDQLLERNGIEVEPSASESMSEETLAPNTRSRRFASRDAAEDFDLARQKQQTGPQQSDEPAVEAVLVEAPEQTILSCLDSLNKDNVNYLGVAVESAGSNEGHAAAADVLDVRAAPGVAGASERAWTRYNRGSVPTDKDAVLQGRYSYGEEQSSFGGGRFGGQAVPLQEVQQLNETELSLARKTLGDAKNAKAVRLHAWGTEAADRAEQLSRASDSSADSTAAPALTQLGDAQRRVRTSAASDGGNLQVLFLLQPDQSASPSPAAKARAQ
jgi:hypothetical protein